MFGDMSATATLPLSTKANSSYTMVGTGITPEAIENNPVMFNLFFEMGWRSESFDLDDWVSVLWAPRLRYCLLGAPHVLGGSPHR